MDPLAEARAVTLLLQNPNGWVHIFCDGSSRWSPAPPDAASYWDPGDVPEPVVCERRTYHQARGAFSAALKRLRARGIRVG